MFMVLSIILVSWLGTVLLQLGGSNRSMYDSTMNVQTLSHLPADEIKWFFSGEPDLKLYSLLRVQNPWTMGP